MHITKLGAALLAAALSTAAVPSSADAASPLTNVFLNNLNPNVDFLDQSSRLALKQAASPKLRAFAFAEAREQTLAANSIDEWVSADRAANNVLASMAANGQQIASNDDNVQSGRSVAIDGAPSDPGPAQVQLTDNRLPLGQEDIDRLEGMNGKAFDAQYKLNQLEALRQIEADYETYIAKGDDPILLGIANRELPGVLRRIAELRKI